MCAALFCLNMKGGDGMSDNKKTNMDESAKPYIDPPKELFYSKDLTEPELVYYIMIVMLSYTKGYCFMSNRNLGAIRGKSIRTMQRIIDGLRTKGYVQVKVYVDDEGNSHRNIIPTKHVKLVMGHVKFDVGGVMSDVGGMTDLSPTPCQNWQHNNNKMNNNKMNKSANADLRKRASYQQDKTETMFSEFYQAYPKKRDKAKARKSFFKIKNLPDVFPQLMKGLEQQKLSADWKKDGGKYIPYPSTWLNDERWEDELATQVQPPASASSAWGGISMVSDETEEERQARVEASIREMKMQDQADR